MSEKVGRAARAVEMRTRLLDAAEVLYAEEGHSALTNRRISAAAETTTQSIYTYFGNREQLVSAMYRRAVAGVEELLALSVAATPKTDERPAGAVIGVFRELARSYRAYCHAHPGRFQLIRAANSDPLAPDDATELREQLVATVVEFGRSSDRLVVEPYEHRVRSALAAIHGFILAELESFIGPEHGADRLFDELVVRCLVPYDLLDALDLD